MAKKKNNRKKKPNAKTVAWREGIKSVTENIRTAKELIVTISQYGPIISNPQFAADLSEEQIATLTESIRALRETGGELATAVNSVSLRLAHEQGIDVAKRDIDVVLSMDAKIVDALVNFNEKAVSGGHIDTVQDIILEITSAGDETVEEEVKEEPSND